MMPFSSINLTRAGFLKFAAAGAVAMAGGGRVADAAEKPIRTRPIPKTNETLPVVGLGTWQTFDVGTGTEERAPREEVLRLLFAAGGKVIDSSPMYGRAEEVTGDLLAKLQAHSRAFVATKVWTDGREAGLRQMEESYRKLRVRRLDLMQVHNLVDWRTHLKTMRAWKDSGRLRYIGITHYTSSALDNLAAIIKAERVDFVQMAYSIGVRDAEERLLPIAAEFGAAVLVNRPYEGGDLFRKTRNRKLPPWATDFDCASWGQFFLKFILSHPAVTCVIPGTAKPQHMADNLAAGRGRLPDMATRRKMIEFLDQA
jgi:aryl-alcohol dehydrogenase-like predicted oxidoreductase